MSYRISSRERRGAAPSRVFDPRGAESHVTVRRAPRGEKTRLGGVRRQPQQQAGEMGGPESGVALLWALLATAAVAGSVLLVASIVASRQPASRYDHRSVVLTALSDAAMAETLARLAVDPASSGIDARRFDAGTISSSVSVTPFGLRLVTAVGEFQGWQSVIRAEVAMEPGPRLVSITRVQAPQSEVTRP
jgi:hypothetical protein